MSQAPSMPVFTDALLGDTTQLSMEEFGAYCMLLFVTWRNNGVALPDDPVRMARICRVTVRRWEEKLRPALAGFFDLAAGTFRQKRLEKEWMFVARSAAISRSNGSLGGRRKSLNNRETENPAGYVQVPSGLTQNEPSDVAPNPIPNPREISNDISIAREVEKGVPKVPDAEFETWWRAYPKRVGKGHAAKAYRAARKEATAEDLAAAAQRYAACCASKDQQFTKHPATWLNAKSWLDEVPVPERLTLRQQIEKEHGRAWL